METENDRVRYVRSATENGVPIFPEEFTLQELERLLTVMGPYRYSCQYLNDPTQDTARKFEEQWLQYFDLLPEGAYAYYVACDPAASVFKAGGGVAKDSDFTAIVTIAVDTLGNIFVVDVVCDRIGVDEFVYELFRVVETYHPVQVGIETNAFQRALLFPIRAEMKRSNTHFNIIELKATRAATKQLRILALQPYFANGTVHVRKQDKELLHEYRLFPLAKHDDVLDALAYVVQMNRPAFDPKVHAKNVNRNPLEFDTTLREIEGKRIRALQCPFQYVNRYDLMLTP
jgi:predicted phage terminase large subunit-like protein